ncbi:hypothetical protein [Streptomyces sp. NPDC054808]
MHDVRNAYAALAGEKDGPYRSGASTERDMPSDPVADVQMSRDARDRPNVALEAMRPRAGLARLVPTRGRGRSRLRRWAGDLATSAVPREVDFLATATLPGTILVNLGDLEGNPARAVRHPVVPEAAFPRPDGEKEQPSEHP